MIAGKTWRESCWMAVTYTLLLEVLLVPAIVLWPTLRPEAASLARMIPADFVKRLVDAITSPDSGAAYRAYMAIQMFFKGVNVVGIACAVLLGTGVVARERENQTLEFLLGRPVSRSRVLWDKYWVLALVVVVPIFLTSWSAVPLSWIIDHSLPFAAVTIAAFHNALFVLTLFTFTVLCSVLFRSQVHVAFAVGTVIVIQVGIFFVQQIRVASLFRFSDFDVYGPVLAGNVGFMQLFLASGVWLLGATVLLYLAADRAFRRMDL
ncbi:MAG: ABC transporter permease [Planctomycetes bacterium]|nr:ABC transporter permease [Planctomycetota bacterium]